MSIKLPVGYFKFCKKQFFNYQLNRWYSLGYTRLEDIKEAGKRIKKFEDNKTVFEELAERALEQGRLKNAAFYYRAAEFLVDHTSKDKIRLYNKFRETFYEAFSGENIERHQIKYKDSFLSSSRLAPEGDKKGVVLIHGGFDSFIEEFYCMWKAFSEAGYEVIAFDGPGQGATLNIYNIPHEHDWEKPVGAILDYYNLSDVTLLGISFGGYWCLRAAAFEKRVKRVIAHSVLYDLMEGVPPILRNMVYKMVKLEGMMNASIRMRMKLFPEIRHVVNQCLHINHMIGQEPIKAAHWLLGMNKEHLNSHLIDQDVLLLAGEKDKFQPVKLYYKQKKALINAKSVTGRVFTAKEHAENHCQMGNLGLALNLMLEWNDKMLLK